MMKNLKIALFASLFLTAHSFAAIRITEWLYQGQPDSSYEFIEFTNVGAEAIDMTGWSFDDDGRTPGAFDLSDFGIVAPGQSVILTEVSAEAFRDAWNLDVQVKVIGDLGVDFGNNLGRADEINLYDADDNLIDQLTYADNGDAGGPRTRFFSGNIPYEALGLNNAPAAVLSAVGDVYGSWTSTGGDVGNPGVYVIPEPATMALMGCGLVALLRRRTR